MLYQKTGADYEQVKRHRPCPLPPPFSHLFPLHLLCLSFLWLFIIQGTQIHYGSNTRGKEGFSLAPLLQEMDSIFQIQFHIMAGGRQRGRKQASTRTAVCNLPYNWSPWSESNTDTPEAARWEIRLWVQIGSREKLLQLHPPPPFACMWLIPNPKERNFWRKRRGEHQR